MTTDDRQRLQQAAADTFGWQELRPYQLAAMEPLVAGRDVLAVLPTGSGKSAIYQVAALLLPGATVVVSPLLALQRDQQEGIEAAEAPEAVTVNSLQRSAELAHAWQAVGSGDAEYLFVSPEQLAKEEVLSRLAATKVGLFVVDEAHCVSAWGHDFRPDYLRLGEVVERLGHPPVVALTATAALPVRSDIVARLALRDPVEVVASFDRPNLRLVVDLHADDRRRRQAVTDYVCGALAEPGTTLGLVYTSSRKGAEDYASALTGVGVRAAHYHAGLTRRERERVHEAFLADQLQVVVATSAFGMGIDKPDVRFVVHAAAPESLDSYYQQVGRAGRDGEPAAVTLCYRPKDMSRQRFLTARSAPREALEAVVAAIAAAQGPLPAAAIPLPEGISAGQRSRAVNLLSEAGVLVADADAGLEFLRPTDPAAAVAAALEVDSGHQELTKSRIAMMRGYAETTGCRRQFLLGYFGEQLPGPCGNCDTCDERDAPPAEAPDAEAAPYPASTRVRHVEWGPGLVMSTEPDRLTVLFDSVGYRTLGLSAVLSRDLLSPEPPEGT